MAKCTDCTKLDAKENIYKIMANSETSGQTAYKFTAQFVDEFSLMAIFLHVVDWITQKLHVMEEI